MVFIAHGQGIVFEEGIIVMGIAVFEPYYGGSHRAFIDELVSNLDYTFKIYTLPANRWKWRMRLAAPFWAGQVHSSEVDLQGVESILCSSFLDVATFKGMLPVNFQRLPIRTYFHENQFAYPVQEKEPRDAHFALTNLTTALSSDMLAFNSAYNLDSFMAGCRELLVKSNDMPLVGFEDMIRAKSRILPPCLESDKDCLGDGSSRDSGPPVIVWNHRWEHDKDPDFFFKALYALQDEGVPFRLIVLGQSFRAQPQVFSEAREVLSERIIHFGYAQSRAEYLAWLKRADIVVSTARHEFFGLSVLEAVRAGCCPLLPRRLVYPELFDEQFLYDDCDFVLKLRQVIAHQPVDRKQAMVMAERFSWPALQSQYEEWLTP